MNWLILIMAFCAGIGTSIQAGVNGALGKKVGTIEATFISFLVGTAFLSLLVIFSKKGNLLQALEVPKWQLIGGLLGGIYILIMVFAVPKIGIAAAMVMLIAGQISSSIIIDHFGIIGDKHIPINLNRIISLFLMAMAIYFFNRK